MLISLHYHISNYTRLNYIVVNIILLNAHLQSTHNSIMTSRPPVLSFQRQVDAKYLDLSTAFDLKPHTLLIQ